MTRAETLTLQVADGTASPAEIADLFALTDANETDRAACLALLEIEALLRGRRTVEVVDATMARLAAERGRRTVEGVMAQIPRTPKSVSATPAAARPAAGSSSPATKRSRRPWVVSLAAVFFGLAVVAAIVWNRGPAPVRAQIAKLDGRAWLIAGKERRAVKTGAEIREGDRLVLDFESAAEVRWVGEAATMELVEFSEIRWLPGRVCELKKGGFAADVVSRAGKSPLIFQTPEATAHITGTRFSLHSDGNATQLRVREGHVRLADKAERGKAEVGAGQFAAASDAVVPQTREWPGDGSGIGLLGEYFNHDYRQMAAALPAYERLDARIRFNWRRSAPTPVTIVHPEHYGVRWTGFIEPRFSESYSFLAVVDDGARLWVDDRLVLDAWEGSGARKYYSEPVALRAGQRHAIRLEYGERTGTSHVSLFWRSTSQPIEVVPQSQLHPPERSDLPAPGELRALGAKK